MALPKDKAMTSSAAIDRVLHAALCDGNSVEDITTGWSKARDVVCMGQPLSNRVRALIGDDPGLRHWSVNATPHDRAEEGYMDDATKVGISFPR